MERETERTASEKCTVQEKEQRASTKERRAEKESIGFSSSWGQPYHLSTMTKIGKNEQGRKSRKGLKHGPPFKGGQAIP